MTESFVFHYGIRVCPCGELQVISFQLENLVTDLYSVLESGSVPFVYVVFEICGNGSVIDLRG